MIPDAKELGAMLQAHLTETKEAPSAFSLRVSKDKHLARDIIKGQRQPRIDLAKAIMAAMGIGTTDAAPAR